MNWYAGFIGFMMLALLAVVIQMVMLQNRLIKLEERLERKNVAGVVPAAQTTMTAEAAITPPTNTPPVEETPVLAASATIPVIVPAAPTAPAAPAVSSIPAQPGRTKRRPPVVGVQCHHCNSMRVYRDGMTQGTQRYKCNDCQRSFKPKVVEVEAVSPVVPSLNVAPIVVVQKKKTAHVKETVIAEQPENKEEAVHKAHRGLLAKIFSRAPNREVTVIKSKLDKATKKESEKEAKKDIKARKLSSRQIAKLPLVGVAKVSH